MVQKKLKGMFQNISRLKRVGNIEHCGIQLTK